MPFLSASITPISIAYNESLAEYKNGAENASSLWRNGSYLVHMWLSSSLFLRFTLVTATQNTLKRPNFSKLTQQSTLVLHVDSIDVFQWIYWRFCSKCCNVGDLNDIC